MPADGAPVFTVEGRYQARGWTEWTQGFQFGSAILQFDATDDAAFLELGRSRTVERMAPHLTHVGVHDHGFNNVSTYGNLWRLDPRASASPRATGSVRFYELALKVSGAVQARRWTRIADGGFIHSFNGPHSLFVDTIRSLRALALGHLLGQPLMEEQDAHVSLLRPAGCSTRAPPRAYNVYYGREPRSLRRARRAPRTKACSTPPTAAIAGRARSRATRRSARGRAVWPGRCSASPSSSEFSTSCRTRRSRTAAARDDVAAMMRGRGARDVRSLHRHRRGRRRAACWDAGAPGLASLHGWRDRPADPFNDYEPVDSSAAAIAAQGLLRLGRVLSDDRYTQAGLRVLETIFDEPYSEHRPASPGPAAAFGLSLAERMGLRAARCANAARRVEPVGRLPRARGGALRGPSRQRLAVLAFFGPA